MKKYLKKYIQYSIVLMCCIMSVNCQGPLVGEEIKFSTPSVFKNLPAEATQIVVKTQKSNWRLHSVEYNDTIADLSTGKFIKLHYGAIDADPLFSYHTQRISNKWVSKISGSFFFILSESSTNMNDPGIIKVNITANTSKEKRVLIVHLIDTDSPNYFLIEQNPSN